jgi:endoglucanase
MKSCLIVILFAATAFPQTRAAAPPTVDDTVQLLQTLADAPGPSGFEEPVRKIMVEHMKPLSDRLSYDGLGSVIAVQGASGPRIMVDAHMDELGGIIRRVTADGYLTMQMLGGWLDQALVDQRWTIIGSKGPVRAVTGIRDVHIVPQEERGRVYPREWIFLDVGAKSAAEVAQMGLSPGDPVAPDAPFAVMNGTQNYLGKGWDDRVGCAVMIAAMQKLAHASHPNQIFWAATVQEEIGLRGAHTASDVIKPEIGIAIEGGVTRDSPKVGPEEAQEILGAGPAIFLFDSSALPNRKFVALVKQVAHDKNIPLQADLIQGYGDDSAEIQKSNGGVPTVNLVVPVRYTHAHNGIMNRSDFDHMVELVVGLLQALDAKAVGNLRDFTP